VARILIEALAAHSPGGGRYLEGLLPALGERAAGHRIHVLARSSWAGRLGATADGAVQMRPVADWISDSVISRLFFDLCIVPLRAVRQAYDLVVTLANFGPVWCPVPHVVVQQNAWPFYPRQRELIGGAEFVNWQLRRRLCAAEMRWATVNVTPSLALANLIRSVHPSLADRPFRTLPHGTDLSRFSAQAAEGRPPSPARRFTFLCPTKVEVYKALDVLLEATRLVAAERDDFEVQVTTPDRGWPAVMQRAIEAHRGRPHYDRVRFIGFQPSERMPELYRSADAILYPSLCESFGFPLLESMACELPIVAGDLEVNRELCRDAARYYAPHSPGECAQAMREVLVEPARREALRAAARRRVRERDWSWSAYAGRFVELCESVLEPGPAPRPD
jgi:glycosyltransferase involved in cell wall biosynthesis